MFSLAYQQENGFTITADGASLTIKVDKMLSTYLYEEFLSTTALADGESLDVDYTDDGVYKITIVESGITDYYADVNYSNVLSNLSEYITAILCSCENCVDCGYRDATMMMFLLTSLIGNTTYALQSKDFTSTSVINDLKEIYDAIARISKYENSTSSCCN